MLFASRDIRKCYCPDLDKHAPCCSRSLQITIIGTKEILPSNTTDLFPGKVLMIIHKTIDTTRYTDAILDELDLTHRVIESGLVEGSAR